MMEIAWAQWYAGRPDAMSGSKLPKPSAMPGVAGINQVGIGAAAEAEGQALIATLRRTPLARSPADRKCGAAITAAHDARTGLCAKGRIVARSEMARSLPGR